MATCTNCIKVCATICYVGGIYTDPSAICPCGGNTFFERMPDYGGHYQFKCLNCNKWIQGCHNIFVRAPSVTKTMIFDDLADLKINIKCKACFTPTSLPESALTQDIITFTCCGAIFKHPNTVNKIKEEMRKIREKK